MTQDEIVKALREIVGYLRCDEGAEGNPIKCDQCGYEGPGATVDCACYEDWAPTCTPKSRGPGCFNGVHYCPCCGGDDGRFDGMENVAVGIMKAEALLDALSRSGNAPT